MKRILMVVIAAGFCMTTSCAHKTESGAKDVVINDASIDKKQKEKELAAKAKAEADAKAAAALAYTCVVAGDKRTVTLDKGEMKCKVNYTKNGEQTEVAWGQSTPEICKTAFDKIRTNIEGAGFKCNEGFDGPAADEKKPVETASN